MAVTLRGRIKRFKFQKPGWSIAEVEVVDDTGVGGSAVHVCVGPLDSVAIGEACEFEGQWQQHPNYGEQFRVASVVPVIARDARGVIGFLDGLPGIGPVRAQLICDHFGAEQVFTVIEQTPSSIALIPGITPVMAETIAVAYQEQRQRRDTIVLLKKIGLTDWQLAKVFEWAAAKAKLQGLEQSARDPNHVARRTFIVEALQHNPYVWTEIRGFGFATVDRIALAAGVKRNSPQRAAAAVEHALVTAANLGHCFVPYKELGRFVDELTGIRGETYRVAVDSLSTMHRVKLEGRDADQAVYLAALHRAEQWVGQFFADRAGRLTLAGLDELKPAGPVHGKTLNEEQQLAVALACHPDVRAMVLTGGPGRGKTTTVRAICEQLARAGETLLLCSPTGKAAKRLAEQTGHEAHTIHKALAWSPSDNSWMFNEHAPLPHNTIVVDEASMIDIELAVALTKAIKPSTRLVLVGDVDQLPSVGPGNVLRDLIESQQLPTVRLEQIYRQDAHSYIAVNAKRMNRGEDLELDPNATDFFWYPCDSAEAAFQEVLRIVHEVAPHRHGVHPIRDIQVLAPMRKGEIGIYHFNAELQPLLNPPVGMRPLEVRSFKGALYRVGDKVRHTKNNYTLGVMNGEVGLVTAIEEVSSNKKKYLATTVDYGDRLVTYPSESALSEIVLNYAGTVHSSQGSEYPVAVVLCHSYNHHMLSRNLVYTAITRAQQAVYLVGDEKGLRRALRNTDDARRHTRLADRIRGAHGDRGR